MCAKKLNNRKFRLVRRVLRFFLGVTLCLFLILLFIRSSWGQNILVNKAVSYIYDKTNTKVSIDKMFITFDGAIQLEGVFLEDKKGDTLLYSKSLEANMSLWALIKRDVIEVDDLKWEGLRANIIRKDTISGYNFQFLIAAFATEHKVEAVQDTIAKPMNIVLGEIDLKDIHVVFNDAISGIQSSYKIGVLEAEMEKVDLDKMIFSADAILISDSKIKLIQNQVAVQKLTEATLLPFLSANSITLKDVNGSYESQQDKIIAKVKIKDFYTEIPKINLTDNRIRLSTVQLKNSDIVIKTTSKTVANNQKATNQKNTSGISWPAISIEIAKIDLENNRVGYFMDGAETTKYKINPNALTLENLNLKASDIFIKDKKAGLQIKEFNFQEKSGFKLNQFALNAIISEKSLAVSEINIQVNRSNFKGFVNLNYKSLSELIASPKNTNVEVNFSSFEVWLKEFFEFQPSLRKNEYIHKLSKKKMAGCLNLKGSLASMTILNSDINWGKTTKISIDGTVQNSTNFDALTIDIPNFKAVTKRSDVAQIIDETQLNIQLPEKIIAIGSVKGSLNSFAVALTASTTQGLATINGALKNNEIMSYDISANVTDYNIDEFLKDPKLGKLSGSLQSKGRGNTLNNLDATFTTNVSKFQLNDYAIKDLELNGNIKNGLGDITSIYKDQNLNIKLKALLELDSIAAKVNIAVNVIGANLAGLGLMNRNVKTRMDLALDFEGNSDTYKIETNVTDGAVVYDNSTYLVGRINAKAYVDKDTTAFTIKNKLINVALESNTDPRTFGKAMQRHVLRYFYRDTDVSDSIVNPVILKLKGRIAQTPLIKEVFLVNLKDLDTVNIAIDFNEKQRKLNANITAPHINYSDKELDSLSFSMHTDRESFKFNVGFKKLTAGPLNIPRTEITANQKNNELLLNFSGIHKGKKLANVNTKITGDRDRLVFSVHPDSLIFNKHLWKIPADNEVILTKNKLEFINFKVTKNSQSIEVTDKLASITTDHIAIDYKNFNISEFFNYLNPDSEIAKGLLNGNFIIKEPFENAGIIANLSVSALKVLKTDFGTLKVDANSFGENKYNFGAKVSGGDVDLNLQGAYDASNTNLEATLAINKFKMKVLNTLSLGEINETSGSFSGGFKVSGSTSEPEYAGKLQFKNANFKIKKLNSKFTLLDETLDINNDGLSMSNFTILDAKKNSFVLSGVINTESFINPTFNLAIKANNFGVLNATKKDNESLYGKIAFNADAKLTGSLRIPKLNAELAISSDTDVTYVLPAAYANVEEREGVVLFVNRENPDAILTQTEEQVAIIKGFDIFAKLKINKQAAVTIIIDKETGDNFNVSGDGDLLFTMTPNGRISLTGEYEVFDGHYELNLYNLVNRKFSLAKGSRVSWAGDPFDAKLDVSAIYKLETSALPLMASQISGEDAAIRNKFKQELPFNVYLNIDGQLLQPKISFNLDMPEEKQGAIGGQVYSRVQQVNQQEDELNRQVFSVLVLNRFYPDAGSDGSSGGFATIARDNLNDAVSGQLNAFSDKILGSSGVELDFGLNSFTEYQGDASTDRTQLDIAAQKKLFNDRLVVRVGSEVDLQGSSPNGEKTPLIGNVSVAYKITEDGTYSIRGFRKSEFENVIDGQTISSGIALIFTREFNDFQQLWDAILREEKTKKEKEDKEKTAKTVDAIEEENKTTIKNKKPVKKEKNKI